MVDDYQIEAISRAVDLCEGRLREPVAVAEMADVACYSLFHFCRVFAQVTGHTPHRYLLRRRLSEAAVEVEQSERNISAIAFDYCFGAPETFARAFRRVLGELPSEWRKSAPHDPRLRMPPLDESFLRHLHERVTFHVEQPPIPARLYGLSAPNGQTTPETLHRRVSELTGIDETWGARLYPMDYPRQPWVYFVGVVRPQPCPCVNLDIPKREWIVASHTGGWKLAPLTIDALRFVRQASILPAPIPTITLECCAADAAIFTLIPL